MLVLKRRLLWLVLGLVGLSVSAHGGAFLREVWLNESGWTVSDIPTNTVPDTTNWVTDLLEAPYDIDDEYGQRFSGRLIAPQSGFYTFWISSDDHSRLRLSTNSDPAHMVEIAEVDGWTWPREWDKYEDQESDPVYLRAGEMYYFEVLMKEGTGGDNLAVRWQWPDGTLEEPMSADHCVPPDGPFDPPMLADQPDDATVGEGEEASFFVSTTNMYPVDFQWQRNGTNLPGRKLSVYSFIASLADSGAVYRCFLSNSLGVVTSDTAVLTVVPDVSGPGLMSVYNEGNNRVWVLFDEAVASATAESIGNYALDGGVTITQAVVQDEASVALDTTGLTMDQSYVLTVSNVTDVSAASNVIAQGTAWPFTARDFALVEVGDGVVEGVPSYSGDRIILEGSGEGIEGKSDDFVFNYERVTGDFDAQVCVQGVSVDDMWAEAGIMARASLSPNSDFSAVLGTPSINGVHFEYRRTSSSSLIQNGNFESGRVSGGDNPKYWTGWQSFVADTNGTVHEGGSGKPAPSVAHDGSWMAMIPFDRYTWDDNWHGGGQWFDVSAGNTYTFSAYYLIQSNLLDDHYTEMSFEWYYSEGDEIYGTRVRSDSYTEDTAAWTHCAITGTAPSGATLGKAVVAYGDTDGFPNGVGAMYNVYWDSAVVTLGAGGSTESVGSYPVNYPYTWLRLKRDGDIFTGFASMDGQRWTELGTVSNAMPSTIYLGMALSGGATSETVTAVFNDWGDVSGVSTTGSLSWADWENLGPCSRRTGLVISEIMYNPVDPEGMNLEFIEIANTEPVDVDLEGYELSGDVDFTFPEGSVLRAGGFLVVAHKAGDLEAHYGIDGVYDWGGEDLPNNEGVVRLRNARGAVLLEVEYSDELPWPLKADGAGHSLVLAKPSYGEREVEAWSASGDFGGSPGRWNPVVPSACDTVVINEFLSHTDPPWGDFIELYNYGGSTVDLSGCVISDRAYTTNSANLFTIPGGTRINPNGFVSYGTNDLGFNLSHYGERLYLKAPGGTQVLDAVEYDGQERYISSGRYPDGRGDFVVLESVTSNSANRVAGPKDQHVVINEIMYHPISDEDGDEYIELYNSGSSNINLTGWRLRKGIQFSFPSNTWISAGGYMVVAADLTNLIATYTQLASSNTVGDFSGRLADSGERIELVMPEDLQDTNGTAWILVDEVTYGDGDLWGTWTDGEGSSLELVDARSDNSLSSSWGGSDESGKSSWTTLSYTGVLDHGTGSIAEIHMLMLGAGECLVDNLSAVRTVNNRVTNGTFNAGLDGWLIQGDHLESEWNATNGVGGSGCLHVRADSGGDTGVNRIETELWYNFNQGDTVALEVDARWLAGHRDLLVRLEGNYLELVGQLPVPEDLGSPGQANSIAVSNAGPAIEDVKHSPILPAAYEDAVVSAKISDPDGVASVQLKYRLDPAAGYYVIDMNDDGVAGDLYADDGYYSGTITGRAEDVRVAFHVVATDSNASSAQSSFPAAAPDREALVLFGQHDPDGNLGTYRVWMTADNLDEWSSRPKLSNLGLDATLVYGRSRAIYNGRARYRGSSWIRPSFSTPTGGLSAVVLEISKDEPFLGVTKLNLDTLEPWRDNTYQRERTAFWMGDQVGISFSYQRYVHFYINDLKRGDVYGDTLHVSADYMDMWYPDDPRGDIYKLDDWFEFPVDGSFDSWTSTDATLEEFTTTGGVKKKARYRWTWEKRSNKGLDDDYTSLFALVDAMNLTNDAEYISAVQSIVDVDEWCSVFALRHALCDWDGYGYARGKNTFAYKPDEGRWQMLLWDFDMGLGIESSHARTNSIFHEIHDVTISNRFLGTPVFRRAYLQNMLDIVDGPMLDSQWEPQIDDWYEALRLNDVSAYSPADMRTWIGLRRNNILKELEDYESPFSLNTPGGGSTNRNVVTLSGTAPLDVRAIAVNGVEHAVDWLSVSNWQVSVVLAEGTNTLVIDGLDADGNRVDGGRATNIVEYTGSDAAPADWLVINEVMYNPTNNEAEFVEFYNRSTSYTFDLNGFTLAGVQYTFDASAQIGPEAYAVVVENVPSFVGAYGSGLQVLGTFADDLDNGGETLTLYTAEGTNEEDVVDRVTYDDAPPWPIDADNGGSSLQLIDVAEDNDRVGNWAASTGGVLATPGASNNLAADLPPFGAVRINEIEPDNTAGATDGMGDADPWLELFNGDDVVTNFSGWYLTDDYDVPDKWAFPAGAGINSGEFKVAWMDNEPGEATPAEWHATFALQAGTNGTVGLVHSNAGRLVVVDYMHYGAVAEDHSFGSYPDGDVYGRRVMQFPTPGAANDGSSVDIRINEWMASNSSIEDEYGETDDWFELYNAGMEEVDLSGYYMSDEVDEPDEWSFPSGVVIAPGDFLLVWADEDEEQCGGTNAPHADFKLSAGGETIGLYTPALAPVHVITFGEQEEDVSEGLWPDGQTGAVYTMAIATPWEPNIVSTNNSAPSITQVGLQTADEEAPFSFMVSAVDTDHPTQTLTFSLDVLSPSGTDIDAASGQFSWTPTEAHGPGVYTARVWVADNGWTSLSASADFAIEVQEVNKAPFVSEVDDQVIYPASLFLVDFDAADPDQPANDVVFSLAPGAPPGASIASGNGRFTWRPGMNEATSTNPIGVVVTDNGVPSLSATSWFSAVVAGTNLQFVAATELSGQPVTGLVVSWPAVSGRVYRVEYQPEIEGSQWGMLGSVTATGEIGRIRDDAALTNRHRYYRILEQR